MKKKYSHTYVINNLLINYYPLTITESNNFELNRQKDTK